MKRISFLLILCFMCTSTCWADSTPSEKTMAIHTYGGGELLAKVFNSLSMLIYGNAKTGIDKTFNSILRIAMTIGGFCCICIAFFKEKFDPLIKNFFFPCLAVMGCLLVPRTTIYIQDHLIQKEHSPQHSALIPIDNVPFFLGKLASLVSTISYQFTHALENVAHGVNDELYDWTGHIYADENIFLTKKCRIAHPVLEENFREFCRECVFRDIGLGLYSKEDLIHTPHLLSFLQEHTSKIRTMYYRELSQANETQVEGTFLPCKEAMQRMNALFNQEAGNTKQILLGEIGSDSSFLLKQKNAGESSLRNLIKQQIAINVLKEEIPGTLNSFASKRAEMLQKENQKILGALGANAIVAMRNFFEATIYMVFPLSILICLLSFGIKPLIHWTHFILWVNTWPVFYVVVKFLLNAIWEFRTKRQFGTSFDLTIFTSEGLSDLYSNMESIAAVSLAFIPYLSWILIKGGVSQMVQLASSIMSPAQSASSTAATEKTYGNYSYGNVSLDNFSGYNAQSFQENYTGRYAYGNVSVDSGMHTMTYVPSQNELFLKQGDSYLREGISKSRAFSNTLQNSYTHSETALTETSRALSEGINDSVNQGAGFIQAYSKQMQTGENFHLQTNTGVQEAYQYIQGLATDYSQAKGVGHDKALREVLSAGIGLAFGVKGTADLSYQDGVTATTSDSLVERLMHSDSFQKHIQTIQNASKGEMAALLGTEDARAHEDFVHSLNKTESCVDQWKAAYSSHQALSNLKSDAESDSLSLHQNLNQRFVEFLHREFNDIGKITTYLEMPNEHPEKQALIEKFTGDMLPAKQIRPSNMHDSYTQYQAEMPPMKAGEHFQHGYPLLAQNNRRKVEDFRPALEERIQEIQNRGTDRMRFDTHAISKGKDAIHHNYNDLTLQANQSLSKGNFMPTFFLEKASSSNILKTAANYVFSSIPPGEDFFNANMLTGPKSNYQELFGVQENHKKQ